MIYVGLPYAMHVIDHPVIPHSLQIRTCTVLVREYDPSDGIDILNLEVTLRPINRRRPVLFVFINIEYHQPDHHQGYQQ
jgi:hypothetical protein